MTALERLNREEELAEALGHVAGLEPGGGDYDFVLHEIAHFALLYRRAPKKRLDWKRMQQRLDKMPCGRAQVHECRALRLEQVACQQLKLRFSLQRSLEQVWSGIRDVVDLAPGEGTDIVASKRKALILTQAFVPSKRAVNVYIRTIRHVL
jgi:hypothetical protein